MTILDIAFAIAPALSRHLSIERVARLKPATRGIHRYALAKKKPQPIRVEVYFWWRRRELHIDCKLLINIGLMLSLIHI